MSGKVASAEALKRLREQRAGALPELQARLKDQIKVTNEITRLLKEGPRTVPALAEATGMPTQTVFWQLMALKKYGRVAEGEQDGDYFEYRLVGEER
ncbi:MAG TPA: winged helix-turn-helix domain-containing protein [Chloroflexota bacterium]|nr:winged helix-turn-helix domain-containing protein [Chloroflexota bacterium]